MSGTGDWICYCIQKRWISPFPLKAQSIRPISGNTIPFIRNTCHRFSGIVSFWFQPMVKFFPLGAGGISYRYRKVICGYDPQFRIPESESENLLAYWGRPTFLAFPAGDLFRILDINPRSQVEKTELNAGGHITRSSEAGSGQDTVPDDEALYLMREMASRGNPAFQSNKSRGVPEVFQDPGALFVFREFCENISRNLPCLKTRFRPGALDETIRMYVSWVNELETANRSKTKNRRKTA